MPGSAPAFWWRPAGWTSRALAPAAAVYGRVAARRMRNGLRSEVKLPVLCVGNPIVGGGGKTPTAIALAGFAKAAGLTPGFLTRGHGGTASSPVLVDPARHDATLVGDEPLLLARVAPTAVAVDRGAGAALLIEAGCDFAIMDDGFQGARIAIDHALLVVDSGRGVGNGRVVPAGPLRAPLGLQLDRADALLVVGSGSGASSVAAYMAALGKPVLSARIAASNPAEVRGRTVLAISGLADNAKFHATLTEAGAVIGEVAAFADHHVFTDPEIETIRVAAALGGLLPVTSEKDAARLRTRQQGRLLLAEAVVLGIEMRIEADVGRGIVDATCRRFAERKVSGGPTR